MRDWNLTELGRWLEIASFVAYLWGIETVGNWMVTGKWVEVCSLPMRDWNDFDKMTFSPAMRPVCSLPMRDWNACFLIMCACTRMFVAYLWGIETSWFIFFLLTSFDLFVAYLWGIETSSLKKWGKTFYLVCSLPMRDWNVKTGKLKNGSMHSL